MPETTRGTVSVMGLGCVLRIQQYGLSVMTQESCIGDDRQGESKYLSQVNCICFWLQARGLKLLAEEINICFVLAYYLFPLILTTETSQFVGYIGLGCIMLH